MKKYNLKITLLVFLFVTLFSFPVTVNGDNNEFQPLETIDNIDNESDEFQSFDDADEFSVKSESCTSNTDCNSCHAKKNYTFLYWWFGIISATMLAGFMVKYKVTRKFRVLFLLLSVVILGFYRGGCPCMISSLQNTFLFIIGKHIEWQNMLWFLGLIPITYVFGKVWCGWICHLGALQEFLFISKTQTLFRSQKAQKIMTRVRISLLIILILQLLITKTNIYRHYGPFKIAYNLFSANLLGYILLALVLLSSLFIYRPFCKTICPVGLILGWITKIPGASILGINDKCAGCTICNNACKMDAITRDNNISHLNNENCILCGDCMDSCKIKSISLYKKGEEHNEKIKLKGIKNITGNNSTNQH